MKCIWFFIVVLTFVRKSYNQRVIYPEEIEFCSEKIGNAAQCVQITQCLSAKDDLKQGKTPVTCGFSDIVPLVCCSISSVIHEPKITPDLTCGRIAHERESDDVLFRNDTYDEDTGSERLEINTDGSFIIQPRILQREKFRVLSNKWPWMVAIYLKSNETFVCNGFLIDSSHLLTAAHCFQGKRWNPRHYYIGTIDNEGKMNAEVIEIHIHHHYKDNYYNDIALLKISPQQTDGVPICIPSSVNKSNYTLEADISIVDWVGTEYAVQTNKIAELRLCDQFYTNLSNSPFPDGITNEFICAVPAERNDNLCQVHSGGPVMVETNGIWMAIGIATFGIPCTLPTYPAVYTRISTYLEWIRHNM